MNELSTLRTRSLEPLSIEQLQRTIPAIFAEEPHDRCSDRYVFISTKHVLDTLAEEGFFPMEARLSRCSDPVRRSYTKHMIRFRSSAAKMLAVGDTAFEIVMRNAHDGTSKYDFMAALFRLTCLNGMTVSDGTFASLHVKHIGDREAILANIAATAHAVLKEAPRVLEAPRVWSEIELKREEQMAFAKAARVQRFGDSQGNVETPITAEQLLHPRRPDDVGNSLWKTFNRVQENVTRGGVSARNPRTNRRTTSVEVRGIDADIKLNKALWTLGEEMAKLKSR
jgi:hypothetical protein